MATVKLYSSQHISPSERARGLRGEKIRFVRFKDLPDTFMSDLLSDEDVEKPESTPGIESQSEPMIELVWRTDTRKFFSLDWRNLGEIEEKSFEIEDIPPAAPVVDTD